MLVNCSKYAFEVCGHNGTIEINCRNNGTVKNMDCNSRSKVSAYGHNGTIESVFGFNRTANTT